MKKLAKLLIFIFIPLFIGFVGGVYNMNGVSVYLSIRLPPFSADSIIFPAAWAIAFLSLGAGTFAGCGNIKKDWQTLFLYSISVFFLLLRPFLFFKWGAYWAAFFGAATIWSAGFVYLKENHKSNKTAFYLFLPYMLWMSYMMYFSFGTAVMNGK
jgi:tryptophan-rich sensory protein